MKIEEKLLTVNQYSRPGIKRNSTTKIAVHYVANPGTSAIANRNYFGNCKTTGVYVSSNYIVGLDGEVIRCVPDDEIAYCTNQANAYSISIETCHPDQTGKFNPKTYSSLVELCALLLKKYKLEPDDLIRHFDVTGKVCPKCFVIASKGGSDDEKNSAWNKFKSDVKAKMNGNTSSSGTSQLYRVRKSWADAKSQIGAFSSLDNAKKACKPGFSVFDANGKKVFPEEVKSGFRKGQKVKIRANTPLFANAETTVHSSRISGTYYIYDGVPCHNGRYRITVKPEFCGLSPAGKFVTGFVSFDNFE